MGKGARPAPSKAHREAWKDEAGYAARRRLARGPRAHAGEKARGPRICGDDEFGGPRGARRLQRLGEQDPADAGADLVRFEKIFRSEAVAPSAVT